jgi:hypothetical protein
VRLVKEGAAAFETCQKRNSCCQKETAAVKKEQLLVGPIKKGTALFENIQSDKFGPAGSKACPHHYIINLFMLVTHFN